MGIEITSIGNGGTRNYQFKLHNIKGFERVIAKMDGIGSLEIDDAPADGELASIIADEVTIGVDIFDPKQVGYANDILKARGRNRLASPVSNVSAGGKGREIREKLRVKHTILQQRKEGLVLYNQKTGKAYSLDEVSELSENNEVRKELRRWYFSDLLRLYATSQGREKSEYKRFIEALSTEKNAENIGKKLEWFEESYGAVKNSLESMDPDRIKLAKPSDFGSDVYVRFEDGQLTQWPEEDDIGFLPFDKRRVRPERGPLLSVIPVIKLIRDGYLLPDGRQLNGKWSQQKRQDYLRSEYGIDVSSRQRAMIFFQAEKGACLNRYNNYENIVVGKKVPLVRVIYKK